MLAVTTPDATNGSADQAAGPTSHPHAGDPHPTRRTRPLTVGEAASMLGVSKSSVQRLVTTGELLATQARIGAWRRIHPEDAHLLRTVLDPVASPAERAAAEHRRRMLRMLRQREQFRHVG